MNLIIIGFVLTGWITDILTADVRLVELDPNDAAQLINRQDQTLRYAPKIESHVPALRYLGNQQQRVLEDIYLANQYHGQDGLGAYVYGYSVPDIAKTEKKERSGDLKGAYEYIAGNGQEIKVQYWDDGTGFHQIDNVPKNLPEDDPDVKAAKEEHLRIWHEQALRNSIPPTDPNQRYFEQQYQEQPHPLPQTIQHYQPHGLVHNVNHQQAHLGFNQGYQQPLAPPSVIPLHPNSVEYAGQYSSNQQAYAASPSSSQPQPSISAATATSAGDNVNSHSANIPAVEQSWSQGPAVSASQVESQKARPPQGYNIQNIQQSQESRVRSVSAKHEHEEEDQTGPPKGFFYSFDYPVGIIVGKEGQQKLNSIYTQNKEHHEQQLNAHAAA